MIILKLCIICSALILSAAKVLHMQLSSVPLIARRKQRVRLTCTVQPAGNLTTEIMFVRVTNVSVETCGVVFQTRGRCHEGDATPGYRTSCCHGTNVSASETKIYALDIDAAKPVDYTKWLCQTKDMVDELGTVVLKDGGKLLLKLSAKRNPVTLGQKVMLVCTVAPADDLEAHVMFLRRSDGLAGVTAGRVVQHYDRCGDQFALDGYLASCGLGTNSRHSRVKIYTLHVYSARLDDFAEWWCHTIAQNEKHNTVVLQQTARAFDGLVGVPVSVERTTRDVSSGLTALTVIIVLEIAVVVVLFLVYNSRKEKVTTNTRPERSSAITVEEISEQNNPLVTRY